MRIALFSTTLFIVTSGAAVQEKSTEAVRLPELRTELARRVQVDQEARFKIIKFDESTVSQSAEDKLVTELMRIDRENTAWLSKHVDKHGWLGKSLVGSDGAHNAWLLVQHADQNPRFQNRCLELMVKAPKGEVAPVDIAYLTDRVLRAAGKAQRYGTQCRLDGGKAKVDKVEDPANLNKRRAEMGLGSIEEYLARVEQMYAPQRGTVRKKLQAALNEFVASSGVPGATLAVAFSDGQVIDLAAGFTDPAAKEPMPVGACMLAGSTGKTFVSAVALQLVQEGKLRLDQPVADFFKGTDAAWFGRLPNSDSLTIRSLMNHTSGIPRYIFQRKFLEDLRKHPLKARAPRECLAVLHGVEPLHPVGKGWGYSDSNYLVLGLVIEKVTDSTYYSELKKRVLDPLKLHRTQPSVSTKVPGLVLGHMAEGNPFGLPILSLKDGEYVLNPAFEWCGGGLVSNSADLAKWMVSLHTGKVLQNKVYTELITPTDFETHLPGNARYGLGTFVWNTEHGEFLGHAGMMPGYLTQIEFSRKHKFAIALQVNTDHRVASQLHSAVQSFARIAQE